MVNRTRTQVLLKMAEAGAILHLPARKNLPAAILEEPPGRLRLYTSHSLESVYQMGKDGTECVAFGCRKRRKTLKVPNDARATVRPTRIAEKTEISKDISQVSLPS